MALIVAAAVALMLCAAGSPWEESPEAALVVTLLSAVPLVWLAGLTLRVYLRARRLQAQVSADRDAVAALEGLPEAVRSGLLAARQAATARAIAGDAPEASSLDPPPPAASAPAEARLVTAALDHMTRRFAAGETIRADALRNHVENRSLDLLEPLQRAHERAFAVGLAGTVLGLGVQTFLVQRLAEGALLSQSFLVGVVLKASATFVGILVASYARSLRWRLMAEHDAVNDDIEAFVSLRIAPGLVGRPDSRDWTEAVERIVGHLDVATRQMSGTMVTGVGAAMRATRRHLKQLLTTELAQALSAELTAPFAREMEALRESVRHAGFAITGAAGTLGGAAGQVGAEIRSAMTASSGFIEALQQARDAVSGLNRQFESVLAHATESAELLSQVRGELELSIEKLRAGDGAPGEDSHVAGEVIRAAEAMREGQRSMTQALHDIVRLQERAGSDGRGMSARRGADGRADGRER